MFVIGMRENILRKIFTPVIILLLLGGIVAAEETVEDISSAELTQFAVDLMGGSNQEAQVTGFDIAESKQIGYSSDGKVIQTISYENIGNGSVFQWGESGDMAREERTLLLDKVGDSGFTWQWNKDEVNQTINVRNSENVYLKQVVGGLKKILFPDPNAPKEDESGTWTFCGKAVNGKGGLPLCAQKMANKILDGKANARDIYMLQYLEEYYDVFPPENRTPHIVLTKWNLTQNNGSIKLKFTAYNFGKKRYNATLKADLIPRPTIIDIDGNSEDMQGREVIEFKAGDYNGADNSQIVELGNYSVYSLKSIENEVTIPVNDIKIKNLRLRMVSD